MNKDITKLSDEQLQDEINQIRKRLGMKEKRFDYDTHIKIVKGEEIEYGDVIHHHTESTFGFWERIKILFGKRVIVHSEIYTIEPCSVITSEAKSFVPRLIKRKQKGGGYETEKAPHSLLKPGV